MPTPTYRRWYDNGIFLNTLVYCLEHLSQPSGEKLARVLCQACDRLLEKPEQQKKLKAMDAAKIAALKIGSHRKARWYDQHPLYYKTFNRFYMLTEEEREEIAHRFFIPAQILLRYEMYARMCGHRPSQEVVIEVLRSSLKEEPERMLRLYGFYMEATREIA